MEFFKRHYTLLESGFFSGFSDIHSHILPGVDDGAGTMEEALQILSFYGRAGVSEVWLTPHIMEDIPNTVESLKQQFSRLSEKYGGKVTLHLSAENMLDNLFDERFESGDFLPIGGKGNAILVETSYVNPPIDLYGKLSRIRSKGYYPVLAHPERYVYMDDAEYKSLKRDGVLFQLNLFSLAGSYGNNVMGKAGSLLKQGLYDLCGCDVHSYPSLQRNAGRKIFTRQVLGMLEPLRHFMF